MMWCKIKYETICSGIKYNKIQNIVVNNEE